MFDGRMRGRVDRVTQPVGRSLATLPLSPNQLTVLGMVFSAGTCVSLGTGHLSLSILGLALAGLCDLLDGPMAKAKGCSSVRGALLDSVADRVSDALLLGGFGWYLISFSSPHLALLPVATLGVTMIVSYERAKAEIYSISAKGGLMERAERIIALGLAVIFSAFMIEILWVVLVLTTFTAISRFIKIWNGAKEKDLQLASLASALGTEGLIDRDQSNQVLTVNRISQRESSISAWRQRHAQGGPSRWRSRRSGDLTRTRSRRVRARTMEARHTRRETTYLRGLTYGRDHRSTKVFKAPRSGQDR